MDLSNLFATKHAVIYLTHPITGEQLYCDDEQKDPFTWSILGKHTAEYKKLLSAATRKAKEQFGDKKMSDLNDDELEQFNDIFANVIVETTVGFNIVLDGKKVKYSRAKAEELLNNEALYWLRDQVVSEGQKAANFILA